jgi:hypothetical protein
VSAIHFAIAAAQQIPEARFSWVYAAEAVFFVGIVYGLIRWIGRTLREVSGSEFRATDREQQFMESVLEQHRASHVAPPGSLERAVEGAGPATLPNAGRRADVTALVHCPGCGLPLTAAAYPLPFVTICDGCARRVNVRGDGPGRIAVVAEERRGAG